MVLMDVTSNPTKITSHKVVTISSQMNLTQNVTMIRISNNTAMHAQNERQTQRSQACGDTQSGGHLAWADI